MSNRIKTTIIGAAIGAVFPLASWAFHIYVNELEWSLSNIVQYHRANYVIYVIDLAPFILASAFYYFSTKLDPEQVAQQIGEKAELLLDAAAEGFYGINTAGECTFANDACVKLLGYQSKSELLGKDMHKLIHHSHRDNTDYPTEECKIYKAFNMGLDVHADDEVFWRADGTYFDVNYNSNPIFVDDTITGAIIGFSDISERRHKEEIKRQHTLDAAMYKDALNEITLTTSELTESSGFRPVIESVCKIIAETLKVERVSAWKFAEDRQSLVALIHYNRSTNKSTSGFVATRKQFPIFFGQIGTRQYFATDLANDERFKEIYSSYMAPRKITAYASIPIVIQGASIGTLRLEHARSPREWNSLEDEFLTSTALVVATAMETERRISTEHRARKVIETMIDGLITIDEDGVIQSFNKSAEGIFDYMSAEVIGESLEMLIAGDYREQHRNGLARYVSGGQPRIVGKPGIEVEGRKKDGSHVPISISISEMIVNGQRIFSGVIRDISDQLRLRREHRSLFEELEQLIDTANAPIFGVNKKLQITEWNQFAAKMTGYEKDEVLDCLFVSEMVEEKSQSEVKQVLEQALADRTTSNFEAVIVTRQGVLRNVLLNTSTRRNTSGQVVGVLCVGQDITELREKEHALLQAQKMEAVGQLTGGIAHDFNNLLSIIKGNLRFLQEDVDDTGTAIGDLFDDALSAVDDGEELTKRLLAFSRTRLLQPELTDIRHAVKKYSRFLQRAIGGGYTLLVNLPDEKLISKIDPSQLDNAILNLALNARDAMPDGGTITIDANIIDNTDGYMIPNVKPGNYVSINISDTGHGIEPKHMDRIFEPFFTTKSAEKGSGLGLSMVYGFTKQSGGACQVKSEPGSGTTVSMILPLSPNNEGVTKPRNSATIKRIETNKVILVVEDDPRVRRAVLRDLQKLGYPTIEAENADLAQMIIASSASIDLVFTDILMPGNMNGMMLADWITENYVDLKVVLTSGYSDMKTGIPVNDHFPMVRKPYSLETLAAAINTALSS